MKTILITGATGLVGTQLVASYQKENIKIHYLTTRKEKIKDEPLYKGFYWSVKNQQIDENCLKGVDTIIHLAGATIAKRWTISYQKEILESRVNSCKLLVETLEKTPHQVQKIICASAIGIYPSSLSVLYREDTPEISQDFLGTVTQQWENAIDTFRQVIKQVYTIRVGIVLDKQQGALAKIIPSIQMGVGAIVGDGKQWQSWIHIQDIVGIFRHITDTCLDTTIATFNAVAPNPVTNQELTQSIAHKINRTIRLRLPVKILDVIFGKMRILLTNSTNVSCQKIRSAGYCFQYPTLDQALDEILSED